VTKYLSHQSDTKQIKNLFVLLLTILKMNRFSQVFTNVTRFSFSLIIAATTFFSLQAQCTLSGNYTNTNDFQTALNNAKTAGCTQITLTGSAQYSGDIKIPAGTSLTISGSATINGNGTLTSQNPITVLAGGTLNTNNNTVTVGGYIYPNLGTVTGPKILDGTSGRVLSVEWVDFSAKSAENSHLLTWTTATETNNSHFVVERSTNGRDFKAIGLVYAANKSQDKTNYTFTDATPSVGVNYYRLQAVDLVGKLSPSKVISVNFMTINSVFKAYPTARVDDMMTVEVAGLSSTAQLTIFNAMGQVAQSIALPISVSTSTLTVSTEALTSGFYVISLRDGKRTQSIKFTKS
jgi:hypothetical protein